jgi:UDP-N-acetylglucosamine 1-carboxyvinyltransferase
MSTYKITGGVPLQGPVKLSGAKNSGFKLLIASLLGSSASVIENIGLISEIDFAKENISYLGGVVNPRDKNSFVVDPGGLSKYELVCENGSKSRSGTYYIPILLHRFGRAAVPIPGGDKIGSRPLDRHFDGLRAMGANVTLGEKGIEVSLNDGISNLHATTYRFPKKTHGGTDTLILAAVLAQGQTILENSAQEPEVDDLISFLNSMGADVKRSGSSIVINGVKTLHGTHYTCMMDRNEAVTFACSALVTRGRVFVEGADSRVLQAFLEKVSAVGGMFDVKNEGIEFWANGTLKATDVQTKPHPGFMTDWQSVWTTLATQCVGQSSIFETVYESRFAHVPLLVKMGAKIDPFNPEVSDPNETYNFNLSDDKPGNFHAVKITGASVLSGNTLEIGDIRTGASMMVAGLCANGVTIITDPQNQIERGYENLTQKFVGLGAKIELVNV